MREPVSLESVYTAVQFLDDRAIRSFESVETLEQVYRQAKQRSFQPEDCQKQEGLKVANEKQYLMVLGGPGAGKSTFLRRMGLEALKGKKGKFQHACIPVFIELKKFNTGEINIEKERLSRTCSDKKISLMIRKACCLRLAGWVKVRSSTY